MIDPGPVADLALSLCVAATEGAVVAFGYFGGLWLTVIWLPSARHPLLLATSSLLLRLCWAGLGFYVALGWGAPHLIVALVTFTAARGVAVHLSADRAASCSHPAHVAPWT
jgi:F1F0 ATPase subunit 2